MKRKNTLRILFCLTLAFAMVFSLSSAAFADGADSVDPQLIGEWYCYDRTDDGNYSSELFSAVRSLNLVMPDGVFTDYDTFVFANVGGYEQLIVSTADGKTDLGERLAEYYLKFSEVEDAEVDEDVIEEIGKLSDIEVSYELFDIKPDEVTGTTLIDSERAALDAWENDGLRIHVTASYKLDPLSTQKVDSTWHFYRRVLGFRFLEALLCGEWNDQNGNTWTIGYEADESGSISLKFVMAASDGSEYKGDSISCYSEPGDDNTFRSTIRFAFEDFDSPRYVLGEYSTDSIELLSDSGDLLLTRS